MARPVQLGIACLNSVKGLVYIECEIFGRGLGIPSGGETGLYIKPVVFMVVMFGQLPTQSGQLVSNTQIQSLEFK